MAFTIARPLQQHQDEAKILINQRTQDKIFASYSQIKQTNLLARWSELVLLNETGTQEGLGIQAVWARIKAIRVASNVANDTLLATTDVTQINAIVNDYMAELLAL